MHSCVLLTETSTRQFLSHSGRSCYLSTSRAALPPGLKPGKHTQIEAFRQKENKNLKPKTSKVLKRKKAGSSKSSKNRESLCGKGKFSSGRVWESSTQWKSSSSYHVPIKVHWPGSTVTNYPSGSTYDSISMLDSFLMSNMSPRISAKSPPDDCFKMQSTLL